MKVNKKLWAQYHEALERIGGDEAFLAQLLTIFIQDASQRLKELNQAVAEGNFGEIRHQAHTLKGASANLSLESLRRLSLQLEIAGYEGDLEEASAALKLFEIEFTELLLNGLKTENPVHRVVCTMEENHGKSRSDH